MITSRRDMQSRWWRRGAGTVDFLVDGSLFLDVDVTLWNVRLGVDNNRNSYKVSHGVFRKEALPKFAVKLCSQGFIVGHNKGGLPQGCNYVCHGKCLT